MTKLFGEYLVEKGHLSKSKLLGALIDQIKTIPSVAEIVYENSLMDHEVMLQVLLYQHCHKIGFIEAAKQLSFWTTEIHDQLDKIIMQKKVPLGEILVKSGTVSLDIIAEALDVFLTDTRFNSQQADKQPKASLVEKKIAETAGVASGSLITYFELFSLDRYLEFKILLSLSEYRPLTQPVVSKAIGALRLCLETVRLVGLPKSEIIITAMLRLLEEIDVSNLEKISLENLVVIEGFELKSLDVLWQIREELENKKDEDSIVKEFNLLSSIELISQGVKWC